MLVFELYCFHGRERERGSNTTMLLKPKVEQSSNLKPKDWNFSSLNTKLLSHNFGLFKDMQRCARTRSELGHS